MASPTPPLALSAPYLTVLQSRQSATPATAVALRTGGGGNGLQQNSNGAARGSTTGPSPSANPGRGRLIDIVV